MISAAQGLILVGRRLILAFRSLQPLDQRRLLLVLSTQNSISRSERHLAVETRIAARVAIANCPGIECHTKLRQLFFSLHVELNRFFQRARLLGTCRKEFADFAIAGREQLPCFRKALLDFRQPIEDGLFKNAPGILVLVDTHLLVGNRLGQLWIFASRRLISTLWRAADISAASTFVSSL